MLRFALVFSVLSISVAWFSVGSGDGEHLHEFARWLTSSDEAEVVASARTANTVKSLQQPVGRKVIIPADARGQFEGQFRVNDRTVRALVDTGATLVALNVSTAQRAGIKLKPSDFKHEVQTANGSTNAAAVVLESLEIGRIHVKDVEALILQDSALQTTLVGMSFLRRLERFQVQDHTLLMVQ